MKLLSMKLGNENRAGIVIGDEVLDVSKYLDSRGVLIQNEPREFMPDGFEDALAVYQLGIEKFLPLVSHIENDQTHADECREAEMLLPLNSIHLNPPVLTPGKILAVGLNYAAHAAEQNIKPPETPLIFSKNVTALIAPNQAIQLPYASDQVDYEAELAFADLHALAHRLRHRDGRRRLPIRMHRRAVSRAALGASLLFPLSQRSGRAPLACGRHIP